MPPRATGPSKESRARVVNATVRVQAGGLGVLVPGGFILTAAHCIRWSVKGGMVLGDYYLEQVQTRSGETFRLAPWAVEPVSDIAALGDPDTQEFDDDVDAFEKWREATKPVAVRPHLFAGPDVTRVRDALRSNRRIFVLHEAFPVWILTHEGRWLAAEVRRVGLPSRPPAGRVFLKVTGHIRGGTSGGPVVDGAGRLVGVVSHSGAVGGDGRGRCRARSPWA